MPAIKTNEWLKYKLEEKKLNSEELANIINVSVQEISEILYGATIGSAKTWQKLLSYFGSSFNVSVASDKFIAELLEEIELYGPNYFCNVFYVIDSAENIIIKDYLLQEDMSGAYDDELAKMNMATMPLKEALSLFRLQDKIY